MLVNDLRKSFYPYPKPKDKCKNENKETEKVKQKPIKKITNKQRKIERDRDKNLVKKGKCEYCHKNSDRLDPHEVFGGCNRKRSINNKFIALLCRDCHNNKKILKELKKKYQREYEKNHTREEFIKLIGKSYL